MVGNKPFILQTAYEFPWTNTARKMLKFGKENIWYIRNFYIFLSHNLGNQMVAF